MGNRVEAETSAVQVDGRLEVLPVAEAVGHLLDGLDLGGACHPSFGNPGVRLGA